MNDQGKGTYIPASGDARGRTEIRPKICRKKQFRPIHINVPISLSTHLRIMSKNDELEQFCLVARSQKDRACASIIQQVSCEQGILLPFRS